MCRVLVACVCVAATTACWLLALPMSDPRTAMGAWAASRLICPDDTQLVREGALVACATATRVRHGPALELIHFDSCLDHLYGGEKLCFDDGVLVSRGPFHWEDGRVSGSLDCRRRERHT